MTTTFDEMQIGAGQVRAHYSGFDRWLQQQPPALMAARRDEAEMIFRRVGFTFAVYGAKDEDGAGTERLIPFDLIPRIIPSDEWARMQQGLASGSRHSTVFYTMSTMTRRFSRPASCQPTRS